MRLTLEASLRGIGELLREDVAPEAQTPFLGQSVRMAGGLLTICANWVDDAAAIRVAENAAIRSLLGEVASALEGDLAARLRSASLGSAGSVRPWYPDRSPRDVRAPEIGVWPTHAPDRPCATSTKERP